MPKDSQPKGRSHIKRAAWGGGGGAQYRLIKENELLRAGGGDPCCVEVAGKGEEPDASGCADLSCVGARVSARVLEQHDDLMEEFLQLGHGPMVGAFARKFRAFVLDDPWIAARPASRQQRRA